MIIIAAVFIISVCLLISSILISNSLDYIDGRVAGCQYALQSLAANFHKE